MNTITKLREAATRMHEAEDGASMVEYGLLIAFIALVALVGVTLLGTELQGFFTTIANSL